MVQKKINYREQYYISVYNTQDSKILSVYSTVKKRKLIDQKEHNKKENDKKLILTKISWG